MSSTYIRNLLRVNLSDGKILTEQSIVNHSFEEKILSKELSLEVDPFSPKNKVVILAKSNLAEEKFNIITKSPLTGDISRSSSTGKWGIHLKYNGYDGIIVEGEAAELKYLVIDGEEVQIKSAHDIRRKTTSETVKYLKRHEGKDIKILNIGPAGESAALLASIMSGENSTIGESGAGAILGVKNLKAIVLKNYPYYGKIENKEKSIKLNIENQQHDKFREECKVLNLKFVEEATYWCRELGLDIISTPITIAKAMELYESGKIPEKDCEGVPLNFGSEAAIIEWTKRIGYSRTKLGDLMGSGSYKLYKVYGEV
jgi:aldehyde:ferredoxin oxidoreductase